MSNWKKNIGPDNGSAQFRPRAITWTNDDPFSDT